MKVFKILKHPDGRQVAVKQGWCWPAFFFGVLWALVSRMWLVAIVVLLVSSGLGGIFVGTPDVDAMANLITIISAIILGAMGNEWRESKLESVGFLQSTKVYADNKDSAIKLSENKA